MKNQDAKVNKWVKKLPEFTGFFLQSFFCIFSLNSYPNLIEPCNDQRCVDLEQQKIKSAQINSQKSQNATGKY